METKIGTAQPISDAPRRACSTLMSTSAASAQVPVSCASSWTCKAWMGPIRPRPVMATLSFSGMGKPSVTRVACRRPGGRLPLTLNFEPCAGYFREHSQSSGGETERNRAPDRYDKGRDQRVLQEVLTARVFPDSKPPEAVYHRFHRFLLPTT